MDVRVFRVGSALEAHQLRVGLAQLRIDASVAVRAGQPYVAVWTDRIDAGTLVDGLCRSAVAVNLDHVPLPRRGEATLVS